MDIDLSGQIAIVTGGGRGLGRAMAQRLAAAHAAVAVVARSEEQLAETVDLIQAAGGRAMAVAADIADNSAVERMTQTVEQELGPVDLLINNAGVIGTPGPIWEADPDDWRQTIDVNLFGAFLCARAALKSMVKRRKGRIVNVATAAALWPIPYGHGYCVTKAALLRFTECLAADTREHGVVVFAIDPGTVRTAMTAYLMESEAGQTYMPWVREFMARGDDVPADLCANLVTLLASGKVDSLSGRFIQVSDNIDQLLQNVEQIQQNDLYTLRLRKLDQA